MRNLKMMVLSLSLLVALAVSATAQTKSLFERLGGKEAITAVVDEFAGRVLADVRINKKFAQTDPVRLKAELVDQICLASGGPCQYTGRDMKTTHKSMGVTEGEFGALVEDLVGALNKFNVFQILQAVKSEGARNRKERELSSLESFQERARVSGKAEPFR